MKITIKEQEYDLTLEEIDALKSQLDNKLPTTWEECVSLLKIGYYIDDYSNINIVDIEHKIDREDRNLVPTEAHAKSVLAMCQLMTIAEALNRTCERGIVTFEVAYDAESIILTIGTFSLGFKASPIQFNSQAIAEHAIKHFEQLWYDYFMIEKP